MPARDIVMRRTESADRLDGAMSALGILSLTKHDVYAAPHERRHRNPIARGQRLERPCLVLGELNLGSNHVHRWVTA